MLLAYEEKEQARKAGCLGHLTSEAILGSGPNKHRNSSSPQVRPSRALSWVGRSPQLGCMEPASACVFKQLPALDLAWQTGAQLQATGLNDLLPQVQVADIHTVCPALSRGEAATALELCSGR